MLRMYFRVFFFFNATYSRTSRDETGSYIIVSIGSFERGEQVIAGLEGVFDGWFSVLSSHLRSGSLKLVTRTETRLAKSSRMDVGPSIVTGGFKLKLWTEGSRILFWDCSLGPVLLKIFLQESQQICQLTLARFHFC